MPFIGGRSFVGFKSKSFILIFSWKPLGLMVGIARRFSETTYVLDIHSVGTPRFHEIIDLAVALALAPTELSHDWVEALVGDASPCESETPCVFASLT